MENDLCSKYLETRRAYREKTSSSFLSSQGVARLLAAIGTPIATAMYGLSGQDLRPIPNGIYLGRLIVSFTRTHFIVADLIACGELVEAAVLMRKQMELLARLSELDAHDMELLDRRTPNIRALREQLRPLYGVYSELAHSSTCEPLSILGFVESGALRATGVFPEPSEHARVSLQHLAMFAVEYMTWMQEFLRSHFPDQLAVMNNELEEIVTAYVEVFGVPEEWSDQPGTTESENISV